MATFQLVNNLAIYKEVVGLAKEQNITIHLTTGNEEMEELGRIIEGRDSIYITINPLAINDEGVWVHELLHAKFRLLGYPTCSTFSKIEFPQVILSAFTSLHNSIQHTYVFREMETMGVSQEHINEEFRKSIIEDAKTSTGDTRHISNAVNFLEYYLRYPEESLGTLTKDEDIYCSESFELFSEMLEVVREPLLTAPDYRNAYIKMLRILDGYLVKKIGCSMRLDLFVCVDPVIRENELHNRASEHYRIVDIPEHDFFFLLDNYDNQCSFFIAKQGGEYHISRLIHLLENTTVKDWND